MNPICHLLVADRGKDRQVYRGDRHMNASNKHNTPDNRNAFCQLTAAVKWSKSASEMASADQTATYAAKVARLPNIGCMRSGF